MQDFKTFQFSLGIPTISTTINYVNSCSASPDESYAAIIYSDLGPITKYIAYVFTSRPV